MIIGALLWILAWRQETDPITLMLEKRERESQVEMYRREQDRVRDSALHELQEQTRLMRESAEAQEKRDNDLRFDMEQRERARDRDQWLNDYINRSRSRY